MHHVDDALKALGAIAGRPIAFGADGRVDLVFDGAIRIALVRVDAAALELAAPIAGLGTDESALRKLLAANHLGDATGAGRLALDPEGDVVLCERVAVAGLDGPGLEARVLAFLKRAAFWLSPAGRGLLQPAAAHPAEDGGNFLKV